MTEDASLKLTELLDNVTSVYALILDSILLEKEHGRTHRVVKPLDEAAVLLVEMRKSLQDFRNSLIVPDDKS